jgi:hypothetical protein
MRRVPPIRTIVPCRPAWLRFLRAAGCTIAEAAHAMGMPELEAARLLRSPPETTVDRTVAGLVQRPSR